MVGGHQGLGCNRQRIGGGDQIGFVAHKEIHDGDQNGAVFRPALPEPGTQGVGRQAGERHQPFGMILVAQYPTKRGQRQRFGIECGF